MNLNQFQNFVIAKVRRVIRVHKMYLDNEENRLSVGTERRFEWRNLFKNLRFSGKYGRRHNCRFVFTPVTDFDQCEQNYVESLQRHRPPGGQPLAELPAPASRNLRQAYSPEVVPYLITASEGEWTFLRKQIASFPNLS